MDKKNIAIVGIGVDGFDTLTYTCHNIIKNATLLIGATRMVESIVSNFNLSKDTHNTQNLIDSEKILQAIITCNETNIVVLMSGDTGFHSGATKFYDLLLNNNLNATIYAGISSVSYFASKINRSWNDVFLSSAHGVECNFIGEVLSNKECFFLVGGKITAGVLINSLFEFGFRDLIIYVGENLGYDNEKITKILLDKPIDFDISNLAVVWVVREEIFLDSYTGMILDDCFIRGNVPITKSTVRNHIISLIGRNQSGLTLYDVGAGTGSIAIELALSNPLSTVYAFEINPTAIDLIKQNKQKFNAYNLIVVEGSAPCSFQDFPPPDKVFIGGSKGNMCEIITSILDANSSCFFTVSAIAVETFAITIDLFKKLEIDNFEVIQLSIAKTKSVASYNMLMGENPTFLISGGG